MSKNASPKRKTIKTTGLSLAMTLAIGVGLGAALTPRPAHAVFASEVTQVLNNISLLLNQIQDYTAYGEDITRWKQQAEDMRNQLMSLASLVNSFGMPTSSAGQLSQVDPAQMVRDRCGQGGSVMSRLLGNFSLNPQGDIAAQQVQLCSAITTLEAYQYNESVSFINDTFPKLQKDLQDIERKRNEYKDKPNVTASLQSDALQTMGKYESSFDQWQTRIGVYDKSIQGLKAQQRTLTQIALTGSRNSGVVGQVGKTLILKEALGQ